MEIYDVIKSIDRYLDSQKHTVKLIDVSSKALILELLRKYQVPGKKVMWAGQFCHPDNMPNYELLMNTITTKEENIFLFGLSSYLKLEGLGKLKSTLKRIVDLQPAKKCVVVTLGCAEYLKPLLNRDPRKLDSYQIMLLNDGVNDTITLDFVNRNLPIKIESYVESMDKMDRPAELYQNDHLIVRTTYTKADFPNSLIDIREYSCTYDLLTQKYPELRVIDKKMGTGKQWNQLYHLINNYSDFADYVTDTYGGPNTLKFALRSFNDNDLEKQWILFIAFKVYGASGADYLSEVIRKSDTLDEFRSNLYMLLLEKDYKSKNFAGLYQERKDELEAVYKDIVIVSEYCKRVVEKGAAALYYLTDASTQEQDQIVKTIAKYADDFDRKRLLQILQWVYPKLAFYLQQYDYKNSLLNSYFNEYKFCKITNRISGNLRSMVKDQATKRDYNQLPPRATFVDQLEIDKHCAAYFVDALGVEYLGYLQALCYINNLQMKADIGRCNLPSVTEFNKDFFDSFREKNVIVTDVKELDDMMHEGVVDNDYQHLKEPIHISSQLQVLDKLVAKAKEKLNDGITDRVFLLSDHGASRMVVINDQENTCTTSNKGEHSGRCSKSSELDKKPEQAAAEENDYWCLANYDRFKGGRMAGVELHGGATLEEVCVPIITIKRKTEAVTCELQTKTILVSFKKKAQIKLYISKVLDDVSIQVENGEYHTPTRVDDNYYYVFDIPEVKRAGTYKLTVYLGNNIIATDLSFDVKKEGANERKFF